MGFSKMYCLASSLTARARTRKCSLPLLVWMQVLASVGVDYGPCFSDEEFVGSKSGEQKPLKGRCNISFDSRWRGAKLTMPQHPGVTEIAGQAWVSVVCASV